MSLEDKQKLAQNLVKRYLRENGYQGVIPEVLLTDEAHSFTVDSKDKATGAKRREKIYFSINDIANPDLAFSRLFGHEKGHMNTYDEGKYGEETSIHTREKIGSENKNKVFTEEEKVDYLNNLRNKYKDQKSIEQQFAEAKLVPEKDKEHIVPALVIGGTLLIEYGPIVYNFLSNPQNYQWLQVLIDNPELFATKDAVTEFVEDAKDKGEKLEEAKEEQTQEENGGSSENPDPNKEDKDKKEMKELKKKWGKGSFDSIEDSIEHHYKKHGREVEASDVRQYLRKAKEFARTLKRARRVGEVDGPTPGVVRYEKNGRYIDLAPNGDIISFGEFKPLKPLK